MIREVASSLLAVTYLFSFDLLEEVERTKLPRNSLLVFSVPLGFELILYEINSIKQLVSCNLSDLARIRQQNRVGLHL